MYFQFNNTIGFAESTLLKQFIPPTYRMDPYENNTRHWTDLAFAQFKFPTAGFEPTSSGDESEWSVDCAKTLLPSEDGIFSYKSKKRLNKLKATEIGGQKQQR